MKDRNQHRPVINNSILQERLVISIVAGLLSFEEEETVQADELKMKVSLLYTNDRVCEAASYCWLAFKPLIGVSAHLTCEGRGLAFCSR